MAPARKKTRGTKFVHSDAELLSSERLAPKPEGRPVLDERVPGLLFDSLATLQAAILSASKKVPYKVMRQAMVIDEQEKCELTRATLAVANQYPTFFSQHKDSLEFVAALMVINAAQVDDLLSLIDQSDISLSSDGSSGYVCSGRQALGIGLIVLAPLAILAVVFIVKHWRKN